MLANQLIIALCRLYQACVSPFLTPSCRFSPSCSQYAIDAAKEYPLLTAIRKILGRLFRCHPFSTGGYDPVKQPTKT